MQFPIYQMEGQFGLYLKNYRNQKKKKKKKKKKDEEEQEEKKRIETLIDKYLLV